MLDQAHELEIARTVSARMRKRGQFADDDCVMLIGSSVSGFGHARSDLDLLVSGSTNGRLPLHAFHDGRRVDVDFLDPVAWEETKGWVNTWARSVDEPYEGRTPQPVDDREWWADHLWLYDRVVNSVPITERTTAEFLKDSSADLLSAAIHNYSRALCLRMARRAGVHLRSDNLAAGSQYLAEALLAAVEGVAAARGITFVSDRTVLEKGRRVQTPEDPWDSADIEFLFNDLMRRAWGTGPDRSAEVPAVLQTLLGPEFGEQVNATTADLPPDGHLRLDLVPGWKAQVAGGEGFLLRPDRSLYATSPAVARFVMDLGAVRTLGRPVAAELLATGAVVIEPDGRTVPTVHRTAEHPPLSEVCTTPVAPSPEAWVSCRIAAHWYAMTVWSLSDDLYGAVESGHRNRVMPILRKAEIYLRMMAVSLKSVRSDVGRNVAMDLQGSALGDGFHELLDLVAGERPEDFRLVPERAVAVFGAVMEAWGMPARADMFETSRGFMKQVADVRVWFRVSDGLGIPVEAPATLLAKGGDAGPGKSSVYADPS
ncbi:hypothetical protein AB0I77_00760 [Streptomyces sp. NPDC050619]|uniref:hypothetical protein n=1 Tax=Streptomyces sp. NPDC050619 TaxID=3157214 RepID=UPI00343E194E